MIQKNLKGKLIAQASFLNFVLPKIFGMSLLFMIMIVWLIIIIETIYSLEIQIIPLIIILGLGILVFYIISFEALSRRVKIYEYGIVPSFGSFKENLSIKELFLPYENIADILGHKQVNKDPMLLIIETKDGKKYGIFRLNVGKDCFKKLKNIRDKFYYYSSNEKKVEKLYPDGIDPWKEGYPKNS